jgi:hypothetical protein
MANRNPVRPRLVSINRDAGASLDDTAHPDHGLFLGHISRDQSCYNPDSGVLGPQAIQVYTRAFESTLGVKAPFQLGTVPMR